jgi:hypothetical protein
MRGQNPRRNDDDPDLLDFGSEEPTMVFDKNHPKAAYRRKEWDITFDRTNPDLDRTDPDVAFNRPHPDGSLEEKSLDVAFDRQEREIASDTTSDTRPHSHVLPTHEPSVQFFERHRSIPVVRDNARPSFGITGIALLLLATISLVLSGRLLMGMRHDAAVPRAPIENPSQPTPVVPQAAPTNVLPPKPDPEPPRRSDASAGSAAAPAVPRVIEPAAPRAERPAPQAGSQPIVADPLATGGLFAITRPVGAQVFLDDKLVGTTPLFMSGLSTGSHQVRLELAGFKGYSSVIHVEPNKRFRLAVQLEE